MTPSFSILPISHPVSVKDKHQAAEILNLAFRVHWPNTWADLASALEEVEEMLADDRIFIVAKNAARQVIGWIGGLPEYDGHVWELHPLAVHPIHQHKGIGRKLVAAFEEEVRARNGLTIMLGTDDEDCSTSLAGKDLFKNPLSEIASIRNFKGHPYSFYEKLGYTIVGVVPDANGPGKPDILMAKSVRR